MEEKDLEIYENLYLRDGNSLENFDYEKFLKLYNAYLSLFLGDRELENSFCMDIDVLSYVVYGFSYFHNLVIGAEEFDSDELLAFSLGMQDRIHEMYGGPIEQFSLLDLIFVRSWLCIKRLFDYENREKDCDIICQLVDSNYKISKVYSKDIKGMS